MLVPILMVALPLKAAAPAADAVAVPTDSQPVVMDLWTSHATVVPGESFTAGVRLRMAPGWHVYWTWPGNTGKPTLVQVEVLDGAGGADPARFPAPHVLPARSQDEFALGYEREVLVTADVTVGDAPQGGARLRARASWLACRESCVDGSSERVVTLATGDVAVATPQAPTLEAAVKALPSVMPAADARLVQLAMADGRLTARIALPGLEEGATFLPRWAYPSTCRLESHALEKDAQGMLVAQLVMSGRDCLPGVGGLVCAGGEGGACTALPPLGTAPGSGSAQLPAPMPTTTPAVAAAGPASIPAVPPVPAPEGGLLWFIVLALLGGLILNVMPCVIPVAVPKLLHVVRTAQQAQDPAQQKVVLLKHAGAYTAGVLATMLGLATVVVQLRALGTRVGWGFHFQNFGFLVVIITVLTVLGLGMLHVFPLKSARHDEALRQLKGYRSRGPVLESFLTGLLVTFLGTPCTAPMLGPALGYAFTQPPATTFAIFGSVGVGLASPFLLLATWTGWARLLPTRVSERYDQLTRAMGFLLFATGIWLVGVVATAHGVEAAINVLWVQLAFGAGAWTLGVWTGGKDDWPHILAKATPLVIAATGVAVWLLGDLPQVHKSRPEEVAGQAGKTAPGGVIPWHTFTPARVAELRGAGRTVFVDFTADWCMNCKYNEKTVLEKPDTLDLFTRQGITALKGDYTVEDPVIHQWLTDFQRAGVPLNLLLPACGTTLADAVVLPELYTADVLAEAVKKAGPGRDRCN